MTILQQRESEKGERLTEKVASLKEKVASLEICVANAPEGSVQRMLQTNLDRAKTVLANTEARATRASSTPAERAKAAEAHAETLRGLVGSNPAWKISINPDLGLATAENGEGRVTLNDGDGLKVTVRDGSKYVFKILAVLDGRLA